MKVLLALLLFFACAYAGFAKARAVKQRLNVTEGFLVDIRQLSILMRYKMSPIRELVLQLKGSALSEFWEAFLYELEGSASLNEAWQKALSKLREDGGFSCLTDAEAHVISDFGATLGTSDIAAQHGNMEMALERLGVQAETLRREVAEKGKVYRSLGVLSGLAAAIAIW